MRVVVHLGEPFWRRVGQREVELDLANGATVADAFVALAQAHPTLRTDLGDDELQPATFMNDAEALPEAPLAPGARLYIVWPLSGG
jgi:hypothetical protein